MNRTRKSLLAAIFVATAYLLLNSYFSFFSQHQYPMNFYFHLILSYLLLVGLVVEILAMPSYLILRKLKLYNPTTCLVAGMAIGGLGYGFFHNGNYFSYYQGYLAGLLGAIAFWKVNQSQRAA